MGFLSLMVQGKPDTFSMKLFKMISNKLRNKNYASATSFLGSTFSFTKSNHFTFVDFYPFRPQWCATKLGTILTVDFWLKTGYTLLCHCHLTRLVTLICLISNSCRDQVRITCTPFAPTLGLVRTCTTLMSTPRYYTKSTTTLSTTLL